MGDKKPFTLKKITIIINLISVAGWIDYFYFLWLFVFK